MVSPHLLPEKSTRLSGRGLLLARSAWLIVAALALGVFVAGVPVAFGRALSMTTEARIALAQIGLSDRFPAVVLTLMGIATMAAFASIAGAIFAVWSDDWLAL